MKKFLATLIALNLFAGSNLVFAKTFLDVNEKSENYFATKYLSAKEIIKGYDDGTFKPENEINRAELLKILIEAANIEVKDSTTNCFNDAPYTAWYSPYLCTAKELKIVNGYDDGSFKAWQPVNKVEAIKMIAKVYGWTPQVLEEQPFLDTPIGEWYTENVYLAKTMNLLPENGEYFNPADNINRGNIAEIIYRFLTTTELKEEKFSNELLPKIKGLISEAEKNTSVDELQKNNEIEKIKLADGDITISLSWNEQTQTKKDKTDTAKLNFESHLIKPDGEEVYFLHKLDTNLDTIMEVEETSEKTTIRNLMNGDYEYFIYKYSGEETFAQAGVRVEVYDSKGLAAIYFPTDDLSLMWKIFDLNQDGEISESNTFGYCEILKNHSQLCPEEIDEE